MHKVKLPPKIVALLAEGVDRNLERSRRIADCAVALLAEGVDRNAFVVAGIDAQQVALLAEGVDRNNILFWTGMREGGRPPRGGRG